MNMNYKEKDQELFVAEINRAVMDKFANKSYDKSVHIVVLSE